MFARLPGSVLADCDVDAPDLHILLKPEERYREDFRGSRKAVINPDSCASGAACGGRMPCIAGCRFGAITLEGGAPVVVKPRCEGCGVCTLVCPAGAFSLVPGITGTLGWGETAHGPLVHARLEPGEETSGKLITAVRRLAKEVAGKRGADILVSDGSPGIGCPVISTLTGAHLAVIVTEPSVSALKDLERLVALVKSFSIRAAVVVNKYDISREISGRVEDYCRGQEVPVVMKLPYNPDVVRAVTERRIPALALPDFFNAHGFGEFLAEVAGLQQSTGVLIPERAEA
jgi:MinD superfamily P-loop ATPase